MICKRDWSRVMADELLQLQHGAACRPSSVGPVAAAIRIGGRRRRRLRYSSCSLVMNSLRDFLLQVDESSICFGLAAACPFSIRLGSRTVVDDIHICEKKSVPTYRHLGVMAATVHRTGSLTSPSTMARRHAHVHPHCGKKLTQIRNIPPSRRQRLTPSRLPFGEDLWWTASLKVHRHFLLRQAWLLSCLSSSWRRSHIGRARYVDTEGTRKRREQEQASGAGGASLLLSPQVSRPVRLLFSLIFSSPSSKPHLGTTATTPLLKRYSSHFEAASLFNRLQTKTTSNTQTYTRVVQLPSTTQTR
ncbi:hypothetical protein F4802DRAFT_512943 [Xylaria palmicola]|nr:hypothetical protein F4802DRAFT_512943 [Xylaria palmicola]